jgi:hypothetical protein
LAVGSRGIQALQIITGKGYASRWFGCLDESPRTQRLILSGSVAALEAGFDVSKYFFSSLEYRSTLTGHGRDTKWLV